MDQSRYAQAEDMFKKAIQINPKYDKAYQQLAFTYKAQAKYDEALRIMKDGMNLDPQKNVWVYSELGFCYKAQGRYDEAEEMLNKSIELMPEYFWAYAELVDCYRSRGKYIQAEEILKKAIRANPEDDKAYAELGRLYKEMRMQKYSEEYLKKADISRSRRYNAQIKYNYRTIKRILDGKKIQMVCMQYPMRSIKPLRDIFRDEEGVIFVDNEKSFRDAVKLSGFNRYFVDMFAGDFGHCSAQGNRLIAENIAKAIEPVLGSK
jgi:Flp pilus assembly protein TadD